MSSAVGPVDSMAASIRVQRHAGESDLSYSARVSYSCARAWVWAACIDDGAGGTQGVTKQALNARSKRWILAMGDLYPGLTEWFGIDEGTLPLVYNRMIDIEDVIEGEANGRYVARRPSLVRVDENAALVVGTFELTDPAAQVCGQRVESTITTGLCTLVPSDGEAPGPIPPFWETDLATMEWHPAADVGEVEYANPESRRWGLRNAESWRGDPVWHEGMAIARMRTDGGLPDLYYLARRAARGTLLTDLTWNRAAELWLHLRAVSGNGIVTQVRGIDNHHSRLERIPLPLLPGTYGRYIDALTWPIEGVGDWYNRIVRKEALPTIRNLLSKCDVKTRDV